MPGKVTLFLQQSLPWPFFPSRKDLWIGKDLGWPHCKKKKKKRLVKIGEKDWKKDYRKDEQKIDSLRLTMLRTRRKH